jgi:parallel beta-helix repeat protein
MLTLLTAVGALSVAGPALAADYYVDGVNGLQSSPGTAALPFAYFWQAEQVAKPGDTIRLMPTMVYANLAIQTSGAAGAPITIEGAGASPNLTAVTGGGSGFGIWINAQYVTIQSFDVTAPGAWAGIYVAANNHHVTIESNVVHGAGLDGISTFGDDYMTISHNTVYDNANYTGDGIFASGISTLGNLDIDSSTSTKMIVEGNTVYSNTNVPDCPPTGCTAADTDSDGNGIIVDNTQRTRWDNIHYHGHTLISNNVVYGNGGRGIYTYLSDHVTVTGNTQYLNNQDPYEGNYLPGEVEANGSGDIAFDNNILYSDGGVGISNGINTGRHYGLSFQYCTDGVGRLVAENNVVYNTADVSRLMYSLRRNSQPAVIASNTWGNPDLINPSLAPALADFRPRPGSVALRAAKLSTSVAVDILNVRRRAPATIGAYEAAAP